MCMGVNQCLKKRGPSCTKDHHWRHVRKTLYLMLECDHTVHICYLYFFYHVLYFVKNIPIVIFLTHER